MRPPGYAYDREILAGLFVMLGIFVIGIFSLKITDSPIFRPGTEYTVYIVDAGGIFRNSKVKIAGINVGVVKDIRLQEGQAKVTILLDRGYKIEKGAYILPRSQGILGDRYLEIVLPKDDREAQSIEQEGAQEIKSSSSAPATTSFFQKLLQLILPVAHAQNMYREGEIIPAQPGTASADDVMRKLGDIGDDVKILAKELKEVVKENRTDFREAIRSIRSSAEGLDLILKDLSEKNTRQDLKEAIKGIRESVDNIRDIASRINRGEGSIGKLINDPQAADQLVRALNSIVEFLDRARRTEVIVDLNSNYLSGYKKTKTIFNLRIMPRSSYGYLVGIVQDPGGRKTKETTVTTVGGIPQPPVEVERTQKSAYELNVQFIRKLYHTTFRLGLFENSGGVAIDQEIWPGVFSITGEAYEFGRDDENAHVRLFGKINILDAFYIQGGYDELASKTASGRDDSLFVGLGLQFNDNDLKNFLVFLGFP
ncbi:MAG: MlaD family protein [Bdellovibrionota bacterium]